MCVHCGDVNKVEIKSWDQDQDQTKAKAKITRPRSRPEPDRAVLNHSPASACRINIRQCDKLKQVVQLNFVKVTSTCRYHSMCVLAYSSTAVNVRQLFLPKNRIQENGVSKIVSLRPDQDKYNKPKTKNKACETKTKACETKTTTKTIFR